MALIEIIDKLCHVTTVLANLVREQSNVIAQSDLYLDGNRIAELQAAADAELDEIEMALGRKRNGSN